MGPITILFVAIILASARALALFSKFREPCPALTAAFGEFLTSQGLTPQALGNAAKRHHTAVATFCRLRWQGCSWGQYHALVDHSRAPFAHLFDAERFTIGAVPRDTKECRRLHRPTEEELLDLVVRSEPAVLSGMLDGWPALQAWDAAYLTRKIGHIPVTLSVSEGRFDHPEDPALWDTNSAEVERVVARPAHVSMSLGEAIAAFRSSNSTGLSHYLEYFPLNALERVDEEARELLRDDLQPGPAAAAEHGSVDRGATRGLSDGEGTCPRHEQGSKSREPRFREPAWKVSAAAEEEAPYLFDEPEIAELPISNWLMPKKQLLWMSGGATVGSTHFDPFENLMAVIAGRKTFHLAHPDAGRLVGGFSPMLEGHLRLDGSSRIVRAVEQVSSKATGLHHYASASLSTAAEAQPHLPHLAEAEIIECEARAGDVIFTPSYWWHEVVSHSDESSGLSIGINWFFESFYQRIFPNMSWDRSPHYMQHGQQPLRRPFPRHQGEPPTEHASRGGQGRLGMADGDTPPTTVWGLMHGSVNSRAGGSEGGSGQTAPSRTGRTVRGRTSFAERLRGASSADLREL